MAKKKDVSQILLGPRKIKRSRDKEMATSLNTALFDVDSFACSTDFEFGTDKTHVEKESPPDCVADIEDTTMFWDITDYQNSVQDSDSENEQGTEYSVSDNLVQ